VRLYLLRHRVQVTDYRHFQAEPAEFRTVPGIFLHALVGHGRGLIQLGLLLLIATPIARGAFPLLAFLYQQDWICVLETLIVLGLLFYSLFGAHPRNLSGNISGCRDEITADGRFG
jgi:hypothetical protein